MKKKALHITLLSALLLGIASCEGKHDWAEQKDDYKAFKMGISLSTDKLEFADGQAKQTFIVTSECPLSYSVVYNDYSYNNGWLSLNVIPHKKDGYDEVTIYAEENPNTNQSREATISISDGLHNYSVGVTQAPSAETLSVSATSLRFIWNGDAQDVTVTSNVSWKVSSADNWCTVNTRSDKLFRISVTSNNSYEVRSTNVTIKGDTKTAIINITQQAPSKPVIGALSFSDITKTSVNCTFTFSSDDLTVTRGGLCYSSTNQNPNDNDSRVTYYLSQKNGDCNNSLTGLKQNTTYYVRPFVITSAGTTYGTVSSFTTKKTNSPEEGDNPTPGY